MTRHSRFRVWLATVVGVMLFDCGVLAQSKAEPLVRRVVDPPSSEFRTYIEGELVRVSVPSNWRELPGSNAVTFAPERAYGNAGVKSVFTHGVALGLARNDRHNLRVTTEDFIESYVLARKSPGQVFRYRQVTIGDRQGLHVVLSSLSEMSGELARIEVFTTLLCDDTVFYIITVVPRARVFAYASTFRRVVESIEIADAIGVASNGGQTSPCGW